MGHCRRTVTSNIRPAVEKAIPSNIPEKDQKAPVPVATEYHDGTESNASVDIVEASNRKVINVDDWDREELMVMEPQGSISRGRSSAGTETSQQKEER